MKKNPFDAVKGVLAGPSKDKKKKAHVREVHIRKGHKGGYIAKHVMEDQDGMTMHESNPEYPMVSRDDLHKHLDEHFPEEAQEAAQGGEPQD